MQTILMLFVNSFNHSWGVQTFKFKHHAVTRLIRNSISLVMIYSSKSVHQWQSLRRIVVRIHGPVHNKFLQGPKK